MSSPYIVIRGARTHNLKNIDLDIPKNQLVVITGLSGSGKSSLAFDTLYAEGQRRYVESLSSYARQFLHMMDKPDVDGIEGLSPAIAIEQKSTSHNPRSTVGTVTEIHDYLRLLFARLGQPHCPEHGLPLKAMSQADMVERIHQLPQGTAVVLLAPVVSNRKGSAQEVFSTLLGQGFTRVRVDGNLFELDQPPKLAKNHNHTIELVVDRLKVKPDMAERLSDSVALALNHGGGRMLLLHGEPATTELLSAEFSCPVCRFAISDLEPRLFSFNNPAGACPSCEGLGRMRFFDPHKIVSYPHLSLASGAIRGWDRHNRYYFALLEALAEQLALPLDVPYEQLSPEHQQWVLHGSGEHLISIKEVGRDKPKLKAFEGVLKLTEKRYRETDSSLIREELSRYLSEKPCDSCHGSRLRPGARAVRFGDLRLDEISQMSLEQSHRFFTELELSGSRRAIGAKVLEEIANRLGFLVNVGLGYLSLDRSAESLSGGEAQRIRLASQIGSGLTGVLYVLDEPSIGLHQRDNHRLLATLKHLRDLGNTVVVVEHDEDAMRQADFLVDMGPGAGEHGGEVVAAGTPHSLLDHPTSLTAAWLSGRRRSSPVVRNSNPKAWLELLGASGNNLKNIDLALPLGLLSVITGVSGSGKSTLINDTLARAVAKKLYRAADDPAPYRQLNGLEAIDKLVVVDQSPIGRTPRSNPATYTGMFGPIRDLFSQVPRARERGYGPGRFSFNVKGGRCEQCEGDGVIKVEMHFLPDVYVLCDSCRGARYNKETLEIRYRDRHIAHVLDMTVEQAHDFFREVPPVARKLNTLMEVGLPYIRLGQSAVTLSGGEAQRVKLALELSRRDSGNTLYILDEPTTGLHFQDVDLLMKVLLRLRDHGNTVCVIEHNLEVIAAADWVIDLGPEGGALGGEVIACGSPEAIAQVQNSHTGHYLSDLFLKRASLAASALD